VMGANVLHVHNRKRTQTLPGLIDMPVWHGNVADRCLML